MPLRNIMVAERIRSSTRTRPVFGPARPHPRQSTGTAALRPEAAGDSPSRVPQAFGRARGSPLRHAPPDGPRLRPDPARGQARAQHRAPPPAAPAASGAQPNRPHRWRLAIGLWSPKRINVLLSTVAHQPFSCRLDNPKTNGRIDACAQRASGRDRLARTTTFAGTRQGGEKMPVGALVH